MPLTAQQQEQLVAVYDEAEKSGDTAAMERVRSILAADRQGQAVPGQMPQAPQESVVPPESDVAPAFSASQVEAFPDIAAGVKEGGRRLVAGVEQAAASTKDFFRQLWSGKSYYDPEIATYITGSDRKAITEQEVARRQQQEQADQAAGINPFNRELIAGATESVPGVIAGAFGPLSRADTLTGAIVKNASLAAGEAGLQFDAENDSLDDMLGASFGTAAVTAATAALPAGANVVKRAGQRMFENTARNLGLQEARDALGDFPLSLAQRTGIPIVRTLETQSYNNELQDFYRAQTDDIVARVGKELKQQNLAPGTLESKFARSRDILQTNIRTIRNTREKAWNSGLTQVEALGKDELLPTPELSAAINEVKRAATNPLKNLDKDDLPNRVTSALTKLENQGMLTVSETAQLLQGLTTLSQKTDPTARAYARMLRRSLDSDMQNVITNPPTISMPFNPLAPNAMQSRTYTPGPALKELLQVRKAYKDYSTDIMLLEKSATAQMLGANLKLGELPVPSESMAIFRKMPPERQVQIRQWLEKNDPDTLLTLRQQVVDDAVRRSRVGTAESGSKFDLEQLRTELFDPNEGYAIRAENLFTPQERRTMYGIRRAFDFVNDAARSGRGGSGTPFGLGDITINAVSRNSAFIARQLGRAVTGTYGSRMLTDQKLYEKLLVFSNTRGKAQDVAREGIVSYLQDEYPEDSDTTDQAQP